VRFFKSLFCDIWLTLVCVLQDKRKIFIDFMEKECKMPLCLVTDSFRGWQILDLSWGWRRDMPRDMIEDWVRIGAK
jgi:hypothetical protein